MSSKAIYPKEAAPPMAAAGLLGPDLVLLIVVGKWKEGEEGSLFEIQFCPIEHFRQEWRLKRENVHMKFKIRGSHRKASLEHFFTASAMLRHCRGGTFYLVGSRGRGKQSGGQERKMMG